MAETPAYPQTDWQGHPLLSCPCEGCGYSSFSPGKMAAHVAARHPGPVAPAPVAPASPGQHSRTPIAGPRTSPAPKDAPS